MKKQEQTYQRMVESIGLSRSAARCYVNLAGNHLGKVQTAKEIEAELEMPLPSVYRGLHELETKGFITAHRVYKKTLYRARPMWDALDEYAVYQRRLVHEILQDQHERSVQA